MFGQYEIGDEVTFLQDGFELQGTIAVTYDVPYVTVEDGNGDRYYVDLDWIA